MQVSEAESIVMEVLWGRSPLGSDEVVAALHAFAGSEVPL